MIHNRAIFAKPHSAVWDELDNSPVTKPARWPRVKVNPVEAVVVLIIIAVLIALLLPGSDFDFAHRYSVVYPNSGLAFGALAGEYRLGAYRGGRGWCLNILPDGRYSIVLSGCGGVGFRESGSVKRAGEYFVLSAAGTTDGRWFPRVFRPVNWESRTYLIPAEKFGKFIDAIVKGDEPRTRPGQFYVRGLEQPVTGKPELPAEWANRLQTRLNMSERRQVGL